MLKKSFVINVILIIGGVVVSYSAARMVRDALTMHTQSAEMIQKIEQLKAKKQELEAQLTELQTKEAVERQAKERLNFKKTGEQVVVVIPEKKQVQQSISPLSFWEKFKSFFRQ